MNQILICILILILILVCCSVCIHKHKCEPKKKEKTVSEDEDEMVDLLKRLAIGFGAKEEEMDDNALNALRDSWRRWGNGPHWDFPHECKHKTKNDMIPCTCGHPHECDYT